MSVVNGVTGNAVNGPTGMNVPVKEKVEMKEKVEFTKDMLLEQAEELDPAVPNLEFPRQGKIVLCTAINLRAKPDKKSDSLEVIPGQTLVGLFEWDDELYAKVETEKGNVGYLLKTFVTEV